jgi:biopolymer transport protein ExbD
MHGSAAIPRGVERSWLVPLTIDSLLHYSLLGSCFACLLASLVCFSSVWLDEEDLLTAKPQFPFVRASEAETASALASPARDVIEVHEDSSVTLDGRTVGTSTDAKLHQLTTAIWHRTKGTSATAPVVICVSSQIQHRRIVHVLNALERANTHDFVLLFVGQSQDDPVWKGRR